MTPSPDIPENEIRERCGKLLSAASEEARRLGHNYVGVEHLFIAVTRIEDGPTCRLLRRANLSPRHVRNEIRREIGTSEDKISEVLPLTPRTEIVLSLAIFLAQQEDKKNVEELHMLMALLQEGEGVPVRKLIDLGFDLNFWLQKLILDQQEKMPFDLQGDDMSWDDDSDFNIPFSDDDKLDEIFNKII